MDRFRYKAKASGPIPPEGHRAPRTYNATSRSSAQKVFISEPEELSPPILRVESGVVGYGGKSVLSHLDLRIDQDDRIALLGQNGQGKSTLAKLISDRLKPMAGQIFSS